MKLFHFLLTLFFCTLFYNGESQVLKGSVTTIDNTTIPFASIYIKEISSGTTTNVNGEYIIPLKAGEYNVYYQALGYEQKHIELSIGTETVIQDVVLREQNYQIKEVKVLSGKEDPAYAIMRKSISLATYFQRQVKSYHANVYLKGSFDIGNIPLILRKQFKEEGIEQGKSYVSESVNDIKFISPNKYEHIQISKRSTIPNDSEDQVMGFINYSFYDVENEDFISPLSRKSFSFYKFRYEGYFKHGEYFINKIKVIPKRKNQKLFSGYIFIVDQLWNLYSVDLTNEQFFGTIRVKQMQAQVKDRAWLPVNHNFDVNLKIMGLKLKANYGGAVEYLDVELDNELPIPNSVQKAYVDLEEKDEEELEPEISKNQAKINNLLEKEELNNREMLKLTRLMQKESEESKEKENNLELEEWGSNYKVVKDTVKRDSIKWDSIRPIPLSKEEVKSFHQKDSIKLELHMQASDTTKQADKSKFGIISSAILTGKVFYNRDSSYTVSYPGLINFKAFNFNSVDGFTYMQFVNYKLKLDSINTLRIDPYLKYGFSSNRFQYKLDSKLTFAPMRRGMLNLSGGSWVTDFNSTYGVNPFLNAVSSLFFKENYKKYYRNDYLTAGIGVDIYNGLRISTNITYQYLQKIENSTNYSFAYQSKDYRNNNDIDNIGSQYFNSRSSFGIDAQLSYTPKYYYRVRKGKKYMQYSKYPTFIINYNGAFAGVFDTQSDYDLLEFRIKQKLEWSFMYSLNYDLSVGKFFNNRNTHFSQFKHFNTGEIPVSFRSWTNNFMLLNDYEYSTNDWYFQAHINYTTPYLIIKNLGFLQDKLWNENIFYHHLSHPEIMQYNEIGYGVSNIFLMGSVGIFAGFEKSEFKAWGLRVAVALP